MTLENMEFPREWFEDEVRDGFFVSCIMKRNWAAQLEILREFDAVSKRLGLKWYLDGGTLLGAVRHHGFIPWDDDLDISMTREDFNILREKGMKLLPEGYYLKDCENDIEGEVSCYRISNMGQTLSRDEHLKRYHNWPYGNGFDIFILENWTDDEELDARMEELIQNYYRLWGMLRAGTKTDNPRMEKLLEIFKNESGIELRGKKHQAHLVMSQIAELYKKIAGEPSDKYRVFLSGRLVFEKKWFGKPAMLSFEGIELPVPSDYIAVVTRCFGDYTVMDRSGGWHDYPSYDELEKESLKEEGMYFGRYTFNKKHIDIKRAESPREKTAQLLEMTDTLRVELLKSDISKDVRDDFLLTAQEIMSAIYEILLPLFVDEGGKVNINGNADKLCASDAGSKQNEMLTALNICRDEISAVLFEESQYSKERFFAMLDLTESAVKKALSERREIVFLPCRAKWWDSMKSAWEYACGLENAKVYVCPIPWYEEQELGVAGKKHDEAPLFPHDIPITPRQEYNIESRHPEKIVIQVPYDNSSLDMRIDDQNYSYYLRNHTDELIYIPPFLPDDPGEDDFRSVKALNPLIEQPAVVFSDTVLLPSKRMRGIYIDRLTELAGKETRAYWEKKIRIAGKE